MRHRLLLLRKRPYGVRQNSGRSADTRERNGSTLRSGFHLPFSFIRILYQKNCAGGSNRESLELESWSWRDELENGVGDLRILCGTLLFVSRFSTLSSQSNPKTQLRALGELGVKELGIGIGNISTMATFTSVGVGEWNWKFENLVRNTVVCLTL